LFLGESQDSIGNGATQAPRRHLDIGGQAFN
jgi:hypothetical protein